MDQFASLFPAGGSPGLPWDTCGAVCWRVGEVDASAAFWALLRGSGLTSKALILFSAERAQPLPVFGSASRLAALRPLEPLRAALPPQPLEDLF